MNTKIFFFSLLISLSFLFSCEENETDDEKITLTKDELFVKGKLIFQKNCSLCHSKNENESNGMAPVLNKINENWTDEKKLLAFIKNAPEEINNSDYTKKLHEKWKTKTQMPPFYGLENTDIEAIIVYLKENKF